jgi:serine/threonine-protein kinase
VDEDPWLAAASPLRTGAMVAGRYRLLRQLGRGGMGEVWSARHAILNTPAAIKFLSIGTRGSAGRLAIPRFRLEAQVCAQLGLETRHIVAVHDAGSDAAGPYLVMEYVRGRTLREELAARGPLAPGTVAGVVEQVAEALAVAHRYGVVHRDLKPGNILLGEQPGCALLVKVADFGIAKALRPDLDLDLPGDTTGGWMLGSPAYMSPEQIESEPIDPHGDLWALGVIVYEALTGELPFPGRSFGELVSNLRQGRFAAPTLLIPSLPAELDRWFRRALAKKKEDRFGSAREMAAALRRAAQGSPRGALRARLATSPLGRLAERLTR